VVGSLFLPAHALEGTNPGDSKGGSKSPFGRSGGDYQGAGIEVRPLIRLLLQLFLPKQEKRTSPARSRAERPRAVTRVFPSAVTRGKSGNELCSPLQNKPACLLPLYSLDNA